jgi:putative tricarboxylic transport membrane protein
MAKNSTAGNDRSAVFVGVLLLVIAAVLIYDAVNLSRAVAYGIGPAMMPKVIAGAMALLGILSILAGLRSDLPKPEPFQIGAVATICAGFLVLTLIIAMGGGFIPAMTVLFVITAWAFGRRALATDIAIGFVLALLIYLLFSKILALSLPSGPLEKLIG